MTSTGRPSSVRVAIAAAISLCASIGLLVAQEPSADVLARALQQAYNGVRDYRASFVQTTRDGVLNFKDKGEGTVAVKKPGMMRWNYTKPDPQVIVSDGRKIYDYDAVTKEFSVTDVPPDDQA